MKINNLQEYIYHNSIDLDNPAFNLESRHKFIINIRRFGQDIYNKIPTYLFISNLITRNTNICMSPQLLQQLEMTALNKINRGLQDRKNKYTARHYKDYLWDDIFKHEEFTQFIDMK